ncbi:MAG TPA: glycosyltransferase [Cyclobacteriaceae bacterium]|nr:glycosyltransferase [Cyclobacteriaceae bacterium]
MNSWPIDRIIICTDAPRGKGLAHYYYLALRDIIGEQKVLIVNDGDRNYNSHRWIRALRRARRELGILSNHRLTQIQERLLPARNVVLLFNNADMLPQHIRILSENPGVFLVNYLSDSPMGIIPSLRANIISGIKYCHLIGTFATDLIPVLYQTGARKVVRIPFGYCKYTHQQPAEQIPVSLPDKVVYFGTWSSEIEDWLLPLTKFDFQIEGNGWERSRHDALVKLGTSKEKHMDQKMVVLARKAGVVVNFTRAMHGCFHTMKTFELAIAGACVVTNYSAEQSEFFRNGQSVNYFNTALEMIGLVERLLNDREYAMAIRQGARESAIGNSYHERSQQLLELIAAEVPWL